MLVHDYIFLLNISIASFGEAMTRYLAESTESGLRLRASSTETLPKLLNDLMVATLRDGSAMSAAFFFFVNPEKFLPSAASTALPAEAFGACISIESTKITSPSLYLRESTVKRALAAMVRFIFCA